MEWRKIIIDGEETMYSVSDTGEVRNDKTNYILKKLISSRGYYTIRLSVNKKCSCTKQVHRLVCNAFLPNIYNKPFVNHIDGNKLNNNIKNLEWCTHQENIIHAIKTGLIKTELDLNVIEKINEDLQKKNLSQRQIAKKYNTSETMISRIKKNKSYFYNINNITEEVVKSICSDIQNNNLSLKDIANKNKVSYNIVLSIKNKQSYKYISKFYNFGMYSFKSRKLNDEQINQICFLIQENKLTYKKIADLYNISAKLVADIKAKKCYRDISDKYYFKPKIKNLNDDEIEEICLLLIENKLTQKEIGEKYNVSRDVIKQIKAGKNYKHISRKYGFVKD